MRCKATTFSRKQGIGKLRLTYRHWFVPAPDRIVPEVIDCTEQALRDVLPGYRVRVEIERIAVQGEGPK